MANVERALVITGASTGIGEACTLRLSRAGFAVFAGVRRETDGQALQAKGGNKIVPIILDVTDAASISAAAERIGESIGESGLAGLVNNAGIAVAGPLEFIPLSALREQLEVNVIGQVAVTQAFLPLLRKARGRVVNMGSIGGIAVTPFIGPYCASKFAMEAITDALRMELAPWGMEVAIIEPGGVATPIWRKGAAAFEPLQQQMPPAAMELYGRLMVALRGFTEQFARVGASPDTVAQAVEHALTALRPKTRYVVGRDAKLRRWIQRLPDRLRDRLILKRIGS